MLAASGGFQDIAQEKAGDEKSTEENGGMTTGEILGIVAEIVEVAIAHVVGHAVKAVGGAMGEPGDIGILFLKCFCGVVHRGAVALDAFGGGGFFLGGEPLGFFAGAGGGLSGGGFDLAGCIAGAGGEPGLGAGSRRAYC